MERIDQAIEMLNKAIKINNKFYQAYRLLGDFYLAVGEDYTALKNYKKSKNIDTNNFEIYDALANYYFQKSDTI